MGRACAAAYTGQVTDELLSSYAAPSGRAVAKEITHLDECCRAFLAMCPFVVLSSATGEGDPDVSPRGGEPGFVQVLDPQAVMLPDRTGNNRLDSLQKITANPRVALLCMVPGIDETLRIYGRAELLAAADAPTESIEHGRLPRSVLVIAVDRALMHCAKALMRARLWSPEAQVPRHAFPSMGEVMLAHTGASGPAESQEDMRHRYQAQL